MPLDFPSTPPPGVTEVEYERTLFLDELEGHVSQMDFARSNAFESAVGGQWESILGLALTALRQSTPGLTPRLNYTTIERDFTAAQQKRIRQCLLDVAKSLQPKWINPLFIAHDELGNIEGQDQHRVIASTMMIPYRRYQTLLNYLASQPCVLKSPGIWIGLDLIDDIVTDAQGPRAELHYVLTFARGFFDTLTPSDSPDFISSFQLGDKAFIPVSTLDRYTVVPQGAEKKFTQLLSGLDARTLPVYRRRFGHKRARKIEATERVRGLLGQH